MSRYGHLEPEAAEPDYGLYLTIFMLAFWPVTLVLGLIDFVWITRYDLNLVSPVLGATLGGLAMAIYRKR